MKCICISLVLMAFAVIGCSEFDTTEPVSMVSGDQPISLEKKGCPKKVRYDGRFYNTVQIGSQCWLQENLDVGKMTSGVADQTNNGVIEKYCYDNDPANCDLYGGLYQWNEAMRYCGSEGVQGICPKGWHIPTADEYQALLLAVGNDGNALKSVGQGTGDGVGTNTSGFSALLGGFRNTAGAFALLGNNGGFISSSEMVVGGDTYAAGMSVYDAISFISIGHEYWNSGFSVRCILD